jgi:ABC-type dipeptide/oligopeptide/nickel transport system permease subunit
MTSRTGLWLAIPILAIILLVIDIFQAPEHRMVSLLFVAVGIAVVARTLLRTTRSNRRF